MKLIQGDEWFDGAAGSVDNETEQSGTLILLYQV